MSPVTQTFTHLAAWLAVQAGARIGRVRQGASAPLIGAVPAAAILGQSVGPNRAGRLVPMPEEPLEPELGRSLGAHWALWAAVVLIVLILAVGYVRRRWKGRGLRVPWPVWGRDHGRK